MNRLPPPQPSWLGRLGVALVSVATVVIGLVTASLLFALLLTVGLVLAGWVWWQFRRLTRKARAIKPHDLEGEYTVEYTVENEGAIEPARPALEDRKALDRRDFDSLSHRSKPDKKRRAFQFRH
ncbi:MAG: hypothetical protein H6974_08055 [Gammaproteobacteria bacterium]|nr:hypothetical protein [Gammaproteobacteria bacterium]MCP5196724.1 hypothetical protein [Gammaproteobacteria bacterium]